jgi:maltose O-acetyltransferase
MTTTAKAKPARIKLAEVAAIIRSFARARLALRGARRGARIRCYGRLMVPMPAGIEVGQKVVFLRGPIPTELRCERGAELVIGASTLLNHGVSIVASRSVRIGARCMFGPMVHVRDHDGRQTAPVTIGDDVWLAHGAVVEPGAVIGDGSVVAAMAVVVGTVPPRSLVAGNPGRCFPLESAESNGEVQTSRPPPGRARPSPDAVRATIIEWLDDTRHFGAASRLIPSDSTSLIAAGLLDSLGLVQLAQLLEERFGVPVDRELAAHPGTESIGALVDLVAYAEGSEA